MTSSNGNRSTSLRPNNGNSVLLDNVDDYLAPSQACINPLFQPAAAASDGGGGQEQTTSKKTTEEETTTSSGAVVVPRRRRRRRIQQPTAENGNTTITASSPSVEQPTQPNDDGKKKESAVKASMADCLACSGCVTTAETVLMEQQHSLTSLRERLQLFGSRIITISPNSWADLCRHWKLQTDDDNTYFFYRRFTTLLSRILSAQVVVDGNVPLQWTWIDEAEEFCDVYRANQKENGGKRNAPYPSVAIDATKTQIYCPDGTTKILDTTTKSSAAVGIVEGVVSTPTLPLISGSCPALVCLVEKTLTNLVPHLSQTTSPMSMVGTVLKTENSQQTNGNSAVHWDHWAIMPCHDKKLEASRKDFYDSDRKEQCVDLVISTKECVELVEEWITSQTKQDNGNVDTTNVAMHLKSLPESDLCNSILQPSDLGPKIAKYSTTTQRQPLLITAAPMERSEETEPNVVQLWKQMAFASGGHANFIFQYAANKLFGCNPENLNVPWTAASLVAKNVKSARLARQRKQHFYEAKLYRHSDGTYSCDNSNDADAATTVLHFAIAHGMQTMQRALKVVANDDHQGIQYLEAMACPHGCVNGGGSARSQSTSGGSNSAAMVRETPTETQDRVKETLSELLVPKAVSESFTTSSKISRTRYHVVPPMQYTMGATAGVQVDKIQW